MRGLLHGPRVLRGPQLQTPITWDFCSQPPPDDHRVLQQVVAVKVPPGSYVRGVEIAHQERPGKKPRLLINVEWSEPVG